MNSCLNSKLHSMIPQTKSSFKSSLNRSVYIFSDIVFLLWLMISSCVQPELDWSHFLYNNTARQVEFLKNHRRPYHWNSYWNMTLKTQYMIRLNNVKIYMAYVHYCLIITILQHTFTQDCELFGFFITYSLYSIPIKQLNVCESLSDYWLNMRLCNEFFWQ